MLVNVTRSLLHELFELPHHPLQVLRIDIAGCWVEEVVVGECTGGAVTVDRGRELTLAPEEFWEGFDDNGIGKEGSEVQDAPGIDAHPPPVDKRRVVLVAQEAVRRGNDRPKVGQEEGHRVEAGPKDQAAQAEQGVGLVPGVDWARFVDKRLSPCFFDDLCGDSHAVHNGSRGEESVVDHLQGVVCRGTLFEETVATLVPSKDTKCCQRQLGRDGGYLGLGH